jgi:hypothetical protein
MDRRSALSGVMSFSALLSEPFPNSARPAVGKRAQSALPSFSLSAWTFDGSRRTRRHEQPLSTSLSKGRD